MIDPQRGTGYAPRLRSKKMPRRAPIDPEGYYHVSSRGSFGHPLFTTPAEHELYLALYDRTARKLGWITLAWALMWNHHHFLVKLTSDGLSEGMRVINHSFARRMNEAAGRTGSGHLVRHGFHAGPLKTQSHLHATCRYIELNASRARGVRPEDWPWSGYRAALGLELPRPFHHVPKLLELFGPSPNAARRSYRRFVEDGLASDGDGSAGRDPFPGKGYETLTLRPHP